MTLHQGITFLTLAITLILFISGRLRYDIVALISLLIITVAGIIPVERAFSGFGNPAVITVVAVLVLSKALQKSGFIDIVGQQVSRIPGGVVVQLSVLTTLVTILSAFMNNVGALALLLPVVLDLAKKKKIRPSYLLMPLAFASLLGGMTTLIGTPPNIIVSSFREQETGIPFRMFDFAPVGVIVAIAGLLFIIFIGWRLIPTRASNSKQEDLFGVENYITEVCIPEDSKLKDAVIREVDLFKKTETLIIGIVRGNEKRMEPSALTKLRAGDTLIISSDTNGIKQLVQLAGLKLVGSKQIEKKDLLTKDVALTEVVIAPNSMMIGGTVRSLNLRADYGVNLLAVSRQGSVIRKSMDQIRFRTGDVLLIQSHVETLKETIENLGCLPLARRDLSIGKPSRMYLAVGIFLIALLITALGWLPVQVAFTAAVVLVIITGVINLQEAYASIDWPIIILLGAMIPVGEAMETTGGAQMIADFLLRISSSSPPVVSLGILLVVTMFLSDLINNAAAVVLMAPIGLSLARGLGVSIDPFLIAVAIGASCAFLTPIGHQSNTLVMGPAGYKFGDYWRMGLLLEVIIVIVALPLILVIWPF